MEDLAGDLDLALLPVWGWGTTLGSGHLDPGGAARVAAILQPRLAVPIHWGTLFPIGMARRRPSSCTTRRASSPLRSRRWRPMSRCASSSRGARSRCR